MFKSMIKMCVVNFTLGLFFVFVVCDGLYLTFAYSTMHRSSRSRQRNIQRIDRFWSTAVKVGDVTPPPVSKKINSKKSISFVPSLATLEGKPSSSSFHDTSSTSLAEDQTVEEAVVDVVEVKSRSRNSGNSRRNNSSSIGELMLMHNRLFLESLKLRKEAIETVLADPRITSLSSSSSPTDSNSDSDDICVSLDIEDRWLQLRDSIGMTRATFKLYASQYPTLAVDILTTPVKVCDYSLFTVYFTISIPAHCNIPCYPHPYL